MIIEKFNAHVNEKIDPVFDSKIHRFGKEDVNWYIAGQFEFKGKIYQTIKTASWNEQFKPEIFKSWESKTETVQFRKKLVSNLQESEAQLKIEKHEKNKKCIEINKPIFESAKSAESNEYLTFKNITPFNSRQDGNGVLLIPAYDYAGFVGMQKIFKDPASGKFEKRFSFGIKKEFSICPLTSFKNSDYCFLSEGFATAASIQMAFPKIPSICAFDAGNLEKAIATIREVNKSIKILIAADKDKTRVGELKAKKCTEKWPDVIYRVVKTPSDEWTDFNDLHCFQSIEEVKKQLGFDESDFSYVRPLGFINDHYYFTSSSNPQINAVTFNKINKNFMFNLAPQKYWAKKYGIEEDEKVIVPWDLITSKLIEECHAEGFFAPDKIRGIGIWKDGSKSVINTGEEVLSKNEKSEFIYQRGVPYRYQINIHEDDQFFIDLLSTFKNLKYKNNGDYIWLCAYIMQAQVFSVMDWRFQLWLTGSRGSGKSEILSTIAKMVPNSIETQNATSAGIVQAVKNDARSLFYDESEADNHRMNQVIELMRQMSKLGDNAVLRGTPSGQAVSFNTNTILCFASIQVSNLNAADKSRVFIVEMDTTENQSKEEWEDIKHNFNVFIENKFAIFNRSFENIKQVKENQKKIRSYLKDKYKLESRLADQVSHAYAFCYLLLDTNEISEDEIEQFITESNLMRSAYIEDNKENDESSCFEHLMNVVLDNQNHTVARAIELSSSGQKFDDGYEKDLAAHGLRLMENNKLFIASKNHVLQKKMGKFLNYVSILKRDKGRLISDRSCQRINKIPQIGIIIKISTAV
jgi:energy-coupling factor transporter ATP-binding protein EcfA2